jgi:small subunit ribosomal protein S2
MKDGITVEYLVPEDIYLTSGVHIGTQQKSKNMSPFIFKVRNDGLYVLDIQQTNKRLKFAAEMIARYAPERVLAVSARQYGQKPVRTFARTIGAHVFPGRFVPGTLTNPRVPDFIEPEILLVTDPTADNQALQEAVTVGIPIIGFCDANNETRNVDLVIPANNKGRRALAVLYWLLTREVLKERATITTNEEFTLTVEDYEATL